MGATTTTTTQRMGAFYKCGTMVDGYINDTTHIKEIGALHNYVCHMGNMEGEKCNKLRNEAKRR